MPVTSSPMRTRSVTPVSAASVVTPSKHSPGPSPYIGWKWSKPQTPSKPSSSAKRALDTISAHGTRCCAISSPNLMPGGLPRGTVTVGRMRIALMSDIHGNSIALDAVLADIAHAGGVDEHWVLGDIVALGPDPIGVLERIVALPELSVLRGNTDRYVVTGDRPSPSPGEA